MVGGPEFGNRPHAGDAVNGHDVVVVGARCAGAATAMLLAAAGRDVLLVDRSEFPSDTLSTHAIARSGVVQLNRWQLLQAVLDTGAPPIRDVAFHVGGASITRTMKASSGVDMMIAPRRHVLDSLLVDAAVAAGARLMTGVTVDGVRRSDDGRVTGVRGRRGRSRLDLPARFVVGADGRGSRIARSVGAAFTEVRGSAGAAHYAYFAGTWPAMEYYVGDQAFAGVFPTNSGEACVWVCLPADVAVQIRRSRSVAGARRAPQGRRDPHVIDEGHHRPAQSSTSPGRSRLGSGWRRRLSPRRDHRPRHQ
jgi:flavin-dependent dehydrogenase